MNAAELMKRIIKYGADEKGINDRFMGSDELYATCFEDLLNEPNVETLKKAIAEKDYARAFNAAHAIKGLSGNLGLNSYYEAIYALVESLRANDYTKVDEEYDEVERRFEDLKRLARGDEIATVASTSEEKKNASVKYETETTPLLKRNIYKKKFYKFISIAIATFLVVVAAVYFLFDGLLNNYEKNTIVESANHLVEINYQLQQYIEDRIESDWMIAQTVRDFISHSEIEDDERMLDFAVSLSKTWRTSDIVIFTKSGHNINLRGEVQANDMASQIVYSAQKQGRYMTVTDSNITYTIPIDTNLKFADSEIVAVSIVKSMESFLDEMDFSSFEQTAYMYLTDMHGVVISKLSNSKAMPVFNIMALFNDMNSKSIINEDVVSGDMLSVNEPEVFLINGLYVVSTPVNTREETLRLVYFVPEAVVNRNMDSFSGNMTLASFAVILIFAAGVAISFMYIYNVRKQQFDTELSAREHMFDLLVKKTRTVFGLFELNKQRPVYISSNSGEVFDDALPGLFKRDGKFFVRSDTDVDTGIIRQINDSIRKWNGKSEFRSGFLINSKAVPASYFELQLFPISDESNEYIGIAQDVTMLYERETATKNALEMAERANEAKTRFLSNMSHDIRTPMNAIVNMADFAIEDINNPEKLREHLHTIRDSSDHLLLLINDILDMSRIESGKAAVEREPFNLKTELIRLKDIVAPLCAAKGQMLITDFDGVHTGVVIGDRAKVSQILMNLLSNAVKFTPEKGAVRFTAKETSSIRGNIAEVTFIVEDTGIGISEDFIDHIFEPFARGDAKRVTGIQGTGLGLSICRSYASAMGGIIKCESEVGEGSTFTFELFFERTNAQPVSKTEYGKSDSAVFIGKHCLLCEDNPTNQRIAKTVLERLGFCVDVANNGREGLTTFEKSQYGFYDIIYMDIQMPVMDGYEATAAIRRCDHAQARTIPIIAMTANVFIEDIEKARIAGMNGHVGKPISTSALINETRKAFDKNRRATI